MKPLRLEDFHISAESGFLTPDPLHRLPDAYYEPWEQTVDDLMHLLVAGRLRSRIQHMPVPMHDGVVVSSFAGTVDGPSPGKQEG